MSNKHLFNQAEGLVAKASRGLISYNPSLALIESDKVVFDTAHARSNVSILSGGGAGHEPAYAGYVGKNMLAASISGEIFASPSTKQILTAIESVPSDKGTILVVLNYTGDCLNFGLACEKANSTRQSPCGVVICGDDVAVGRKDGLKVGRRGLTGQVGVCKMLGAASAGGATFDECMSLGIALAEQLVSIAATLDHCSVPGRSEHTMLKSDEIELGTGPHNEPGYFRISPIPGTNDFISTILKYLLDEKDPDRSYVHFEAEDEVVLIVSNFGGVSTLEMGALVDELLSQLDTRHCIIPCRVYAGSILTSLNAPAFSTTLLNLTAAAKKTSFSVAQIIDFLDMRTETCWESMAGSQAKRRPRREQFVTRPQEPKRTINADDDLQGGTLPQTVWELSAKQYNANDTYPALVDPVILESMVRKACGNLIAAEPDLTKYDMVMGDGDCGETLKTGASAMLLALDSGVAKSGSVLMMLRALEDVVETKMGGTLGAILGIFFVSLSSALRENIKSASGVHLWGLAIARALSNLERYTPAKIGDRTSILITWLPSQEKGLQYVVMDTLIPFANTLQQTRSFSEATEICSIAAVATKDMVPKLGRATYVGGMEGEELPPDPGAMGAMEAIKGLLQGMN